MRLASERALAAPVLFALTLAVGACAGADETAPDAGTQAPTAARSSSSTTEPVPAPVSAERTDRERQYLDELAGFGLPTGMSAETTVEVGIGICESIADGADFDTIIDHIRPLSSAIASQSTEHDTDRVGRAIVEASRTHLCD